MKRPTSAGALFLLGMLVLITVMLVLVISGNRSGGYPSGTASSTSIGRRSPSAAGPIAPPPVPSGAAVVVQENVETFDPTLRRAHDRLLRERPLFQHLPYRDVEIGVGFDRVAADGRLELLVTYLGARSRAVRDLRGLLARYGDPGTAYVERYQRVF